MKFSFWPKLLLWRILVGAGCVLLEILELAMPGFEAVKLAFSEFKLSNTLLVKFIIECFRLMALMRRELPAYPKI